MHLQKILAALLATILGGGTAQSFLYPRDETEWADVYTRDYSDVFAQEIDIYGRDVDELYRRDFDVYAQDVDALFKRAINDHILSKREASLDILNEFYKREAEILSNLSPRAGSRISGLKPKAGSPDPDFHRSSESEQSEGSTAAEKLVGMTRQKTTQDKSMRVVGVNGCTAIFIFGQGFITGAHASPTELAGRAKSAGSEAKGTGKVTSITIVAPDAANGAAAEKGIKAAVPGVPVLVRNYKMDLNEEPGFYSFTANVGSPSSIKTDFIHSSRSPSPKSSKKSPPRPRRQ